MQKLRVYLAIVPKSKTEQPQASKKIRIDNLQKKEDNLRLN